MGSGQTGLITKNKMEKILLAMDGSDNSQRALKKTIELALPLQAEVTVLTVVHRVPFYGYDLETGGYDSTMMQKDIISELERAAQKNLEEAEEKLKKAGLTAKTMIKHGHPADTICRETEEGEYDLVILGSRGLGGFKKFFLGSVSNRVANYAQSSVLIVK